MIEIVKGGGKGGEDALACARREANEELGIVSGRWIPLGMAYEIPSIIEGRVALFAVTDCRFEEARPERVESIDGYRLPFKEAIRMALGGGLDDAITVTALVRAAVALGVPLIT
jgi:ADP-ribose pyrophosphatase